MPDRKKKKTRKGTHRKDLTKVDKEELEALKAELTDSISSSSQNSSFGEVSGAGNVFPIASDSSHSIVRSRVLSSSAPSSPTRDKSTCVSYSSGPSVKSLVAAFESRLCESVFIVNMALREELDPLTKSRTGFKSHVTRNINHLNSLQSSNNLNINFFKRLEQSVSNHLQEIERKDIEISAVYDKFLVALDNAGRMADSDNTAAFILDAH